MYKSCKEIYSGLGDGHGPKSIGSCSVYISEERRHDHYISTTYYAGKILTSVKDVLWRERPKDSRPHSNTSSGK